MASLNVAVIEVVTATPVAPPVGVVLYYSRWGSICCAAVVNDHVLSAVIALPAKSFTAVVIVAV